VNLSHPFDLRILELVRASWSLVKLKLDRKEKRELKRLLSVTQDKREYVQASPRGVDAGPE
jgi:hypothetical protein